MSHFTVVYDACVLFPNLLRDLLMHLAATERFRARWTNQIHEEWMRNVQEKREIARERLERTRDLMNDAIPDCLVTGYEDLIDGLELPDPDDRHVLAAAIRCDADVIVTYNLKDFPAEKLAPLGIEALHPDDFVQHQLSLFEGAVTGAVREMRAATKKPPLSVEDLLTAFERQGLAQTVAGLREFEELL